MSFKIVGIGEILWDLLPSGRQMGGAPANFAYHAQALGAEARVVSRVGRDPLGREILERLQALGLSTSAIQMDASAPTGTVTVALSGDGQPRFTIHEQVAWDQLEITDAALRAVVDADAVCFGSLAQRREPSHNTIQALAAAAPRNALRIFDINLRQQFFSRRLVEESLALANVLKLNDVELPVLAGMLGLHGGPTDQLKQLEQRYELRLVALTRGARGSSLYSSGQWSEDPGAPVSVKDTVGAGDAFTAAMTWGLLSSMPLEEINHRASEVARFVCACDGATPRLPSGLRQGFEPVVC